MCGEVSKDFLQLIRLGIGHSASNLSEGIVLAAVKELASRHGLSAVVLDGLNDVRSKRSDVRSNSLQEKILLAEWIGEVHHFYEQRYEQYLQSIVELASFYQEHGIRMLLMKGYGISLDYPVPKHRPTGDIDIYLFGEKEKADKLIRERLDIRVDEEYHKHSHFTFHDVTVENHGKFIDDITHKSNIRFENLLEELQREEEQRLIESPIDNCLLPSPTWNALFLLRHTGEHFASCEITLRHIIDLGTFFKAHHDEINWERVLNVYEDEGMKLFYDSIATICVRELGFEPQCFCGYNHNEKLADKVLADIFAIKKELPKSMIGIDTLWKRVRYGIDKSQRWWQNRWKYKLVYKESLWDSFWGLAINRIKR